MDLMTYILVAVVILFLARYDFDYTPLVSTTIDKWAENKAIDNVSARSPFFNWLKAKGRIKSWDQKGVYVNEPVLSKYDKTRVQALAEYQEIDLSPESGQILLQFTPKDLTVPMTISDREWNANQGREQMINLVDSKLEQTGLEMADQFEEYLYGDGTAQDGKVFLGLQALISTTNTGTLAGYARATNTWLQNITINGAKRADAWDNLRKMMSRCYRRSSRGVIYPELGLTHEDVFEAYETLHYDKVMLTSEEYANLGFENFKFKRMALAWSEHITDYRMYFINSYAFRLRSAVTGKTVFGTGKMINLEEATAKIKALVKLFWFKGAVTVNAFRTLGVVHSIT